MLQHVVLPGRKELIALAMRIRASSRPAGAGQPAGERGQRGRECGMQRDRTPQRRLDGRGIGLRRRRRPLERFGAVVSAQVGGRGRRPQGQVARSRRLLRIGLHPRQCGQGERLRAVETERMLQVLTGGGTPVEPVEEIAELRVHLGVRHDARGGPLQPADPIGQRIADR